MHFIVDYLYSRSKCLNTIIKKRSCILLFYLYHGTHLHKRLPANIREILCGGGNTILLKHNTLLGSLLIGQVLSASGVIDTAYSTLLAFVSSAVGFCSRLQFILCKRSSVENHSREP